MAKKLGYGGVANTNGARDFSGKVEGVGANTPWCLDATEIYTPGAAAAETYVPGSAQSEVYTPGAIAAEIGC